MNIVYLCYRVTGHSDYVTDACLLKRTTAESSADIEGSGDGGVSDSTWIITASFDKTVKGSLVPRQKFN